VTFLLVALSLAVVAVFVASSGVSSIGAGEGGGIGAVAGGVSEEFVTALLAASLVLSCSSFFYCAGATVSADDALIEETGFGSPASAEGTRRFVRTTCSGCAR
jgi:hypothetical protein